MGVNISIKDHRTYADAEGWDWMRYAGDRAVFSTLIEMPYSVLLDDGEWSVYRPDSTEDFRAALHKAIKENPKRWDQMCDLLAENPNYGLYFSW